jgi:hypothetical protein
MEPQEAILTYPLVGAGVFRSHAVNVLYCFTEPLDITLLLLFMPSFVEQ